jgi:hypothetical protein
MPARSTVRLSEPTIHRICSEYLEMPGMRLTRRQAQRLWGLDEDTCAQALDFLVEARFLMRMGHDTYARSSDGPAAIPSFRMAKASIDRTPGRLRDARAS